MQLIVELLQSDEYVKLMEQMQRTRLFTTGKDIEGTELKTFAARGSDVYSERTIDIKTAKGQPTDKVTGLDSGQMYASIRANVTKLFIDITAGIHFDEFSENIISNSDLILGLTVQNQIQLIAMLNRDLPDKILDTITEEHLVDTNQLNCV